MSRFSVDVVSGHAKYLFGYGLDGPVIFGRTSSRSIRIDRESLLLKGRALSFQLRAFGSRDPGSHWFIAMRLSDMPI